MSNTTALNFGPGGATRFARNTGRSLTGEALGAIRYPSPFFDIASTYLPASFKEMLKWCRYYFLTNPIINAVCYKMAEYSITDLVFDTDNRIHSDKWVDLFENTLHFKKFEVEVRLDYEVYGNGFVSIYYPFFKYLKCKSCSHSEKAVDMKYVFRDFKFVGTCTKCKHHGEFAVRDHYIRAVRDLRLIRWNPENISIQHNEATGENRYYYTIPPAFANDIRLGKRSIIERTPQAFIEALRKNKSLLCSKNNIYHLKRPTIAQKDKGWGMPRVLPVLKQAFYLQILQKAQEAVSIEHIVPLRILFPQSASSSADPYASINLSQWKDKIEQEVLRWRLDNNYIPVMPIPVGQQTLGGDGRALMLSQEYRVGAEHVVSGMQVPIEFYFGGMSYSGSNVSMRMLENHFISQRSQSKQLVMEFLLPNLGAFLGWPVVPCHYKRFKMADDLQRSAFFMQLNQAGKLSDDSLLEDTDWDSRKEADRISTESKRVLENQRSQALAQAAIQGEAGIVMAKYQGRSQKVMQQMMPQDPAMAGQMGGDPNAAQQAVGVPGEMSPMAAGQQMNTGQQMSNMNGDALPGQAQQAAQGAAPQGAPQEAAQGDPQAPQDPMHPMESQLSSSQSGVSMDLQLIAQKVAAWLNQLPENERQQQLVALQQGNPQLYALVLQLLQQRAGAETSSAAAPLPENKPPRRGPEAAAV